MLISVTLFTKYVMIIYGLDSVHEKFGILIKVVPKSFQSRSEGEIPAWLGKKNGWVVPD